MDLYEMARVDTNLGIEKSMKNLIKLRDEGHFKYIGLSECSAETIKKASAIGPVSAVEVEFSPFCPDIQSNGVLDACKEFGIVSSDLTRRAFSAFAVVLCRPPLKKSLTFSSFADLDLLQSARGWYLVRKDQEQPGL